MQTSILYACFHLKPYNPTANPNTATAPIAIPTPAVFIGAAPALPLVVVGSALAAATFNPYAVPTTAVPFTVLVTVLVAVVLAVHADQVVHGAFVLHGPAVQPGQSLAGHALPSHQAVQGAERQSERVDHSDQGP